MKYIYLGVSLIISINIQAQFGPSQIISSPTDPSCHNQYIRTADIDNDGKIDILVGGRGSNDIRYFHNLGNMNFEQPILLPGNWQDLKDIELADINGVGKSDIVSLDVQAKKLFWHPNVNGLFPQQLLILDNLDVQFTRILCQDFNGDGSIDIVVSTFYNAIIFFNDGAGNFSSPNLIMLPTDEEEIYDNVSGDFNNDGKMDIALSGSGILIYTNDGTGNFVKSHLNNLGFSFLLESSDYDNDGFDDLLIATDIKLSHHKSSATGFSPGPIFSPNNLNYQTLFSVDLDNDGDKDLLTAENQANGFFWYENVNAGSSWSQHIISTGFTNEGTVYGVRAADLDGDGDNDLIRSTTNGIVDIYENLNVNPLSVENLTDNKIGLAPNPASDYFIIQGIENKAFDIQIMDLSGKLVFSKNQINANNPITISNLEDGNYLIKITSNEGMEIKKLNILH